MPTPETSTLRLDPQISELARLVEYVETFAGQHGMDTMSTHAFTIVAEELFANTVSHGRPPASYIEFSIAEKNGEVIAVYLDDASPFDPTLHPSPDVTLPASEREIGGLGLHILRSTMQTFRYARVNDCNVVTFGRAFARPAA